MVKYTDENEKYYIDCTKAIWSTDSVHEAYHASNVHLKDVDFIIEQEENLILIEYKNANISGASNPNAFHPDTDQKIQLVCEKFYDSLHYLTLKGKDKPKYFVYILEYPNGDVVTRKRIRNLLKAGLPFALQESLSKTKKLIEKIDVLSIDEWNQDPMYHSYPILPV